ncbi:hypothetical protein Hanom_Chr11g01015881 [Helianthus anomalus]
MFRYVVHGACLREGKPVPKENVTRELADDLRTKVIIRLDFVIFKGKRDLAVCKLIW